MDAPALASGSYLAFLHKMDRLRGAGVLLGLDRVRAALGRLGHPERALTFVQVAGTNGKGSTAAMTEAVLRAAGVHTGLFTSPHLVRFTERIQVGGVEVDPACLEPALDRVLATGVPLTYFEAATLVAVLVMHEAGVEVGVMETGLGGRLDAVTALPAVAAAVTSVGPDHLEVLGPTLADVAREKAAVARSGRPLFVPTAVAASFKELRTVAEAAGARFVTVEPSPEQPALAGGHQRRNAAIAVALAEAGLWALGRTLPAKAVSQGLATVSWPGRLERRGQVLFDCAHNPEGAAALSLVLAGCPERPRVLVVSMVAGKDVAGVAAQLKDRFEAVVFTQCSSERALAVDALRAAFGPVPCSTDVAEPEAALNHALHLAGPTGLVVVAGSTFLVGPLRAHLRGEPVDPLPSADPPVRSP
ncbi:MAG: bifunctional folylpolyglutamate synthase/dihydrofolate synthase [Myxococcales bacterium]|nr:bifunctional folylpolyglutamate synthase/dihydrofolate synthase [Myxococcales bacterium]